MPDRLRAPFTYIARVKTPNLNLQKSRRFPGGRFLAAGVIGFFLQFNPSLVNLHLGIAHFSEIVFLMMTVGTGYLFATGYRQVRIVVLVLFVLGCFVTRAAFGGLEFQMGNGNNDLVSAVGFLVYALGAPFLFYLFEDSEPVYGFSLGFLAGAVGSTMVLWGQFVHLDSLLIQLGLMPPVHTVQMLSTVGEGRMSGMWGHANEAGHVLALAMSAAACVWVCRRGYGAPAIALAIACVAAMFYFAANRGGIISCVIVLGAAMYLNDDFRPTKWRTVILVAILLTMAIVVPYMISNSLFSGRFANDVLAQNASGRVTTTWQGFELMLTHPFGYNTDVRQSDLRTETGFDTPHNGWLALGYAEGIPFLLIVVASLVFVLARPFIRWRVRPRDVLAFFFAIQLATSFMFEELAYSENFMFISAFLISYMLLLQPKQQAGGGRSADAALKTSEAGRIAPTVQLS